MRVVECASFIAAPSSALHLLQVGELGAFGVCIDPEYGGLGLLARESTGR